MSLILSKISTSRPLSFIPTKKKSIGHRPPRARRIKRLKRVKRKNGKPARQRRVTRACTFRIKSKTKKIRHKSFFFYWFSNLGKANIKEASSIRPSTGLLIQKSGKFKTANFRPPPGPCRYCNSALVFFFFFFYLSTANCNKETLLTTPYSHPSIRLQFGSSRCAARLTSLNKQMQKI